MSNSVRPHRWQPTRLPHPWDSPGKNTGVGCHFLLQCMKVKSERQVAQLCLTLSDPMDCSPPSCSIHGIFQARVKKGCYFISWHQNALWEKNIFGLTLEKERWSCQEYVVNSIRQQIIRRKFKMCFEIFSKQRNQMIIPFLVSQLTGCVGKRIFRQDLKALWFLSWLNLVTTATSFLSPTSRKYLLTKIWPDTDLYITETIMFILSPYTWKET